MKANGSLAAIIAHYRDANSREAAENIIIADGFFGKVQEAFYLNFVKDKRYMYLIKGFGVTLYITFFAILMGLVLGFTVAVIRSTADQTGSYQLLNWVCKLYLTIIRGTPVVVQLLIIYFVIFGAVSVDKILVAVIAFGINSGAYVAEIIRGGIMSIDRGQMEAGRS
ncbi:MAG: ABC transporter permease subunit, partial [Lentisphaeria bacterium]|nr:ABC transporter permease subunit [Lentisphaeria bacterium]